LKPRDIEGREVAVRSYAQTAGLWVRGILQHECGVDLDKVTWLTTDKGQLAEYRDSPNCQMPPKGKRIDEMLYSGEIAAAILGNDMPNDPRISTLVPDAPAAARQWYEPEHAIPINHMFAVHRDLSKSRPDVIRELFKKIVASRAAANSTAAIPPFGLEANRKAIGMASDWSYEQKITPRRLSVDELFDENTAAVVAEETAS
jgi:4,5-dihydroxyphthalate decarboxylase